MKKSLETAALEHLIHLKHYVAITSVMNKVHV